MIGLAKRLELLACAAAIGAAESHDRPLPVGGQAVIEGIMMKGYRRWALAVRLQDGTIWREHWPLRPWKLGGAERWPIIRGFLTMIEMLREGFRGLARSTELALGEKEEMTAKDLVITVAAAVLMVIGLFVALPLWGADLMVHYGLVPSWSGSLVEGVLRGAVFIGYLALIGLWGDIQRVLAYHGAEHKVINGYESGGPMTPERLLAASRIHRRCGTSFLLIVVIVSILVFSVVSTGGLLGRIASRVLLLPLVVGISYEIIRGASTSSWGGILMKPALCLQYLTTREPTEDQLEVALRSLEEALGANFAGVEEDLCK